MSQAAEPPKAGRAWALSIPQSFADKPGPRFDKGLFLAYDVDSPLISAWDRSGRLVTQARLSIPSADQVLIRDVAAVPDGGMVVAGSAMNIGGQKASFIAWLSPAGTVERVVRTYPFYPARVCVSTDESVWAAGQEVDESHREVENHPVLRRFSPDGRITHSSLPRRSFASGNHPANGRSSLSCASERIGFFSILANEWVELSSSGTVVGRWKGVTLGPGTTATGMDLLDDGSVYATTVARIAGSPPTPLGSLFRLNKTSGHWTPVTIDADLLGQDPGRRYAGIIGRDGPNLVIHTILPEVASVRIY